MSPGSSRLPLLEYENSTPMPPSTSNFESPSVAPVRSDSSYSSSRCSRRWEASALSSAARCGKVRARSSAPPVRRPYARAAPKSTPAEEILATSSPVTASCSGAPSSSGTCQEPLT